MGAEGVFHAKYDLWQKDTDYVEFVLGVYATV